MASSGNYTVSGHREKVTNLVWVSSLGIKVGTFKLKLVLIFNYPLSTKEGVHFSLDKKKLLPQMN